MADEKVSDLTAITALADDDLFYVVDASDTTDDAAGSSKKITAANVRSSLNGPYAHLTVSTTQNLGGANGAVSYVDWDGTQLNVDTGFTHSTVTNPSRVQVDATGRYALTWMVSITQGGSARTTYMSAYRINGTTIVTRGRQRNYSRGSGYGDTSLGMVTELDLTDGDYIEASITIDDTDSTYTSNCIPAECELIIRRIG